MVNIFNGSAWRSVNYTRKFNGSAWTDSMEKVNRDGNWIRVFPTELNLYNFGNQCSSITGGWSITEYWDRYTTGSAEFLSDCMHTWELGNSYGNKGFRTNNPINMSGYSTIHLYMNTYHENTASYPERTELDICNIKLDYAITGSTDRVPLYNGNPYYASIYKLYETTTNVTQELVGDVTGMNYGYIYIWDTSWSLGNYKNDTRFYRVWLT